MKVTRKSEKNTDFVVFDSTGSARVGQWAFAKPRDLEQIARWPRQVGDAKDLVTQDALGFAKLTCKRWPFYREEGRTALDLCGHNATAGTRTSAESRFFKRLASSFEEGERMKTERGSHKGTGFFLL